MSRAVPFIQHSFEFENAAVNPDNVMRQFGYINAVLTVL